jgi:hypothetical protein
MWFNGRTPASQAGGGGSIPLIRSKKSLKFSHLQRPTSVFPDFFRTNLFGTVKMASKTRKKPALCGSTRRVFLQLCDCISDAMKIDFDKGAPNYVVISHFD